MRQFLIRRVFGDSHKGSFKCRHSILLDLAVQDRDAVSRSGVIDDGMLIFDWQIIFRSPHFYREDVLFAIPRSLSENPFFIFYQAQD